MATEISEQSLKTALLIYALIYKQYLNDFHKLAVNFKKDFMWIGFDFSVFLSEMVRLCGIFNVFCTFFCFLPKTSGFNSRKRRRREKNENNDGNDDR